MYCYKCGAKLREGANFCSGCGENMTDFNSFLQNNRYSNHNSNSSFSDTTGTKISSKLLYIGSVAVIVLAIVIKVFMSSGSVSSTKVGGKLDGLEISLKSFEIIESIPGETDKFGISSHFNPEEGKIFAVAEIEVYNDGNNTYNFLNAVRSYASVEYEGKEFVMAMFNTAPENLLYNVNIAPMMSAEGIVVFQIPEQLADKKNSLKVKINERQVDKNTGRLGEEVKSISLKVK